MLSLTLSALGAASTLTGLKSDYSTTVNHHVSELMPVFLDYELNYEWAERMTEQKLVQTRELGALVYQQHALPWPLSPRDLLLSCDVRSDARDAIFTSECHSVDHASVPHRPGTVRIEMERTYWRFESLPGDRTKISLEMSLPAASTAGIPSSLVRHVQRTSLRDSVTALVAAVERLGLPPARDFVRWRRTRAESAAAHAAIDRRQPQRGITLWNTLWWLFSLGQASTLSLVMLTAVHALAFALLTRALRLRYASAAGLADAPSTAPSAAATKPAPQPATALRTVGRSDDAVARIAARRAAAAAGAAHAADEPPRPLEPRSKGSKLWRAATLHGGIFI